jgi:hypothetical protein
MNGIEGAAGTGGLRSFSAYSAGQDGRQAGMEGALALSKKFLSSALSETGFVDMQSSNLDRIAFFVQHGPSKPEEIEVDLDARTAAELTAYFGDQVTGEVNLVLRLLARVDPERVARLLR